MELPRIRNRSPSTKTPLLIRTGVSPFVLLVRVAVMAAAVVRLLGPACPQSRSRWVGDFSHALVFLRVLLRVVVRHDALDQNLLTEDLPTSVHVRVEPHSYARTFPLKAQAVQNIALIS
jgi:hypothetical protein